MAGFLRGKQTGIANDLSAGITADLFAPDDQARFGINSQTSCLAYDPVQSLFALGTSESRFGPGKIYVFGTRRVHRIFQPPHSTSILSLQFSANRLVSVDARSEISVWDLESGNRIAGNTIAGGVACAFTDPLLDWTFLGLKTGEIVAYDLDRERLAAQFKLPNFWKTERDPRQPKVGIVCLALHPRDIGQLLIGYTHGAVIYSIKQNKATKFLEYVLPPSSPGADGEISAIPRKPALTHAVWHPTGTFIVTAHEDGSLVFWDPKEEKVVMARTLADINIDRPTQTPTPHKTASISEIAWCCKQNPDDTALLVAGGQNEEAEQTGLTFIELGPTPIYATSSWQVLEEHFKGKRTMILPLPRGAEVRGFQLISRSSPYFAGAQDPIAVVTHLSSGELITMSVPSGYPISPTNQLHPYMSFIHPYVTRFTASAIPRERWLGMTESRNQGELILKGGAAGNKPRRRFEDRTILQIAHGDGTVRLWDSGHGDEIENEAQLQVDVARALNRYEDVDIRAMSMTSATGEFAVGTSRGEVVVYRWDKNKNYGQDSQTPIEPNPGGLSNISSRSEPALKEGLQPLVLYEMNQGPITALRLSNIGFVAAGSESGHFTIIDLRGPAILFEASIPELGKEKRSSFLKGHSRSTSTPATEHAVVIEFGIMTLEDDKYSSIACFVGTSNGRVLTFKLLPSGTGFTAALAGIASFDGRVVAINPIVVDTGKPAAATPEVSAGLRNGQQVNGVLVVVTQTEIRVFKPASHKGASKSFDDILCDAACVTDVELRGQAIVAVFGDRTARTFSLPALKEIGRAKLPMIDSSRTTAALVMPTGNIFAWTGPSELAMLESWGAGRPLRPSNDLLINVELVAPPRPTISNMQWLSGTQYVSPTDLDLLIGGPDRPPSKRMMAAEAAEKQAARSAASGAQGSSQGQGGEGWGDYLTRQLNERTEKLNVMGDQMDNLSNSTQGWADDVGKYINKQKKNAVMGMFTSKFL